MAATMAATVTPNHGVRRTRADRATRVTCRNAWSQTLLDTYRTFF